MPRPIFDIEQYELRGTLPEVYTEEQKKKLNSTLARVNGQVDWDAQLLGFSGPNYWGTALRQTDGTYEWKGLPDTVNQKRRMQVGAFGVYGKDTTYDQWPAPFNRSQVGASADASFHIFEVDGRTRISPLNQGEGIDYMHDPLVFDNGYYIFDSEIELEGREIDVDAFTETEVFLDYGVTYTRLRILDDSVGGTILVRVKGSVAEPVPLKVIRWEDISDWNATAIRRQFIGMWGNKGNQLSVDFAVDALDLHGNDERFSLDFASNVTSITPEEILERVGLNPTFWTNVDNFAFKFSSPGCEQAIAVPPYLNGPLRGFDWKPDYIEDEVTFFQCDDNCDYEIKITQVMSEEDNYDNGEYVSFCNSDEIYNNAWYEWAIPEKDQTVKNGNYNNNNNAPTATVDEEDYDHFPRPTEGYEDCQDIIKPIQTGIDNGIFYDELGDNPYPVGRIDEGEYDRNPWRHIERFDIEYIPKTDLGLITKPCLTWDYDPDLDNGTFEDFRPDPLAIQPENPGGGPWATADDGIFDEDTVNFCISDATQGGVPCETDAWCGYDDGFYEMLLIGYECTKNYTGCEADGGIYRPEYGAPDPIADCSFECPPIDNEPYESGYVFLGPPTVDGAEMGYGRYLPPGCTFVEGGIYAEWDPNQDCDCEIECCEVDNGPLDGDRFAITNKVDGFTYNYDYPVPEPAPVPPIPCAEYQPNIDICVTEYVNVDLSQLIDDLAYKLQPNVRNSLVPLRTWKEHPLIDKDEVDTAQQEYWNYLEADTNRGPDQDSNYRHFLRLPLDYERDGREWNKAIAVSNNQDYFSAPEKLQQVKHVPAQPRPLLYSEVYRDAVEEGTVMYEEDFLVSSVYSDTDDIQPGFEDCSVSYEASDFIPFDTAVTVDYDPFDMRIPYADGEWRGDYVTQSYKIGFTGHLSTDLTNHVLMFASSPVYDESMIKRPNVTFPESKEDASTKNWVVSYAYFASDFSAADDPIFDPDKAHCWRQREIASAVLDPEAESEFDKCVESTVKSNTAYLLHPIAY